MPSHKGRGAPSLHDVLRDAGPRGHTSMSGSDGSRRRPLGFTTGGKVFKADDLMLELLLDADREGVHAVIASEWTDEEGLVELRFAHRYADARRATLLQILEPLRDEGFEPAPNREYLPVGEPGGAYGVVLAGRFYGRDDLEDGGPMLVGVTRLLAAYAEAYERG